MARLHQNNFSTNVTSNQTSGVTTTPLNSIPSIAAPFYLAFDATNVNGSYEVVDVTSKTATHVNHAATTYAHTTAEEVRMVVPAEELDAFSVAADTVKATGAEVTTGTDDAKFATPKALADAGVNTRLKTKIITATRDLTAATGAVAYTGVGFVPTKITAFAAVDNVIGSSTGFSDSAKTTMVLLSSAGNTRYINTFLVFVETSAGNYQTAALTTYDADGFTLTWTKTLSPTGTCKLSFLCER